MEGTKFTIDRKIFKSDIWDDQSPWLFKLWIYLLGNANWGDGYVNGILVQRGQILTSYRHLRQVLGYKVGYRKKYPAISTVKDLCEKLTKAGRTDLRTVHQGTLITVCKYNELQPFENTNRTANRTLAEHLPNTKEEEVKNKNKNNGRFTPPSTSEVQQYITEKNYNFDPDAFVAFYESKGWKVGNQPMKNWKSACVTWQKRHEGDKPKSLKDTI